MDRATIILNFPYGQLCNRLYLYANLLAFAMNHQVVIVNLSFFEYYRYFKSTQDSPVPIYPNDEKLSTTALVGIRLATITFQFLSIFGHYGIKALYYLLRLYFDVFYNKKIFSNNEYPNVNLSNPEFLKILEHKKTLVLRGWEYRYDAFLRFAPDIRNYFLPVDAHISVVNLLIEQLRSRCDILVGVHIRHGDYRQFQNGKYFFSIEEYHTVMKNLLNYFPKDVKVTFLICSNEKQDFIFEDLDVVLGTNHLIEDLYLLSKCDYIIGPPSTYNMWASFYGSVPLHHITNLHDDIQFSSNCYSSTN